MRLPAFRDAEAETLRYLRAHLPGLDAGTRLPDDAGSAGSRHPFVVVTRIGGSVRWPALDMATLDVEVWDDDRERGHDLAQRVLGELLAARLRPGPLCSCAVFASLQHAPDPLSETDRWLFSVQVGLRTH